jgi:hypothetical protein
MLYDRAKCFHCCLPPQSFLLHRITGSDAPVAAGDSGSRGSVQPRQLPAQLHPTPQQDDASHRHRPPSAVPRLESLSPAMRGGGMVSLPIT